MSDKFQDIYRIPSARADWWDYGNSAAYFVTICTAGREHYFGEIIPVETRLIASPHTADSKLEMQLTVLGQIAHQNWLEIPSHFPFIKLDVFVVMPNHVHGILVIDKPNNPGRDAIHRVSDKNPRHTDEPEVINRLDTEIQFDAINLSDAINRVSTGKCPGGITGKNNPMLSDNLSRAIRWYKGKTTFQCRSVHADFAWQTRFHDHIIRDEKEYWKIREYILNNPKRWDEDKYNQPETP